MENRKLFKLANAVIEGMMFSSTFANNNITISDLLSDGSDQQLVASIGNRLKANLIKLQTQTFGSNNSQLEQSTKDKIEIIEIIYEIKILKDEERMRDLQRDTEKYKELRNLERIEEKKKFEALENLSLEEIQERKRKIINNEF